MNSVVHLSPFIRCKAINDSLTNKFRKMNVTGNRSIKTNMLKHILLENMNSSFTVSESWYRGTEKTKANRSLSSWQ